MAKIDYRFLKISSTSSGFEDDGTHGIRIKINPTGALLRDQSGLSIDGSQINEFYVGEHSITASDVTSKSFILTQPLADTDMIALTIYGGITQTFGTDYTCTSSTVVSWNGLGLEGTIAEGDQVQVQYPI